MNYVANVSDQVERIDLQEDLGCVLVSPDVDRSTELQII